MVVVTAQPMIRVTDDSTRDEIAEALGWTNLSAKRQQRIIERFMTDEPSAWTRMHRKLNAMLDDWQAAKA